ILVDRKILMDAGAPLTVHLPRAGVSLDEPRAVVLSHFHADHTFGLAWLILGRVLLNDRTPSLSVYGPKVTTSYHERLLDRAPGGELHLARKDIKELMARHPAVRFILTQRGGETSVNGAVMARDFLTLQLPLH